MKTRITIFVLLLTMVLTSDGMAQQKLAQTGMKFLNVISDARAAALGGGMTAYEGLSSTMFLNPAGIARLRHTVNFSIGRTQWIADINHTFGSVAFKPWDGTYGVVGLFVQSVDYGELHETVRSTNAQAYLDLGTFKPSALALGLTYARAVNEDFSFGVTAKLAHQYLANGVSTLVGTGFARGSENSADVAAFDFGILYHLPFNGFDFGMTVRNFSREARFIDDDFQLPLTFKIGMAMNLMDVLAMSREDHDFRLYIDAEHPRDYQEQVRIGGEYTILQMFSLRAGYVSGTNEEGMSFGIGHEKQFDKLWFGLDYAYTAFGVFGGVHRFSFQFSL
jgi:hypothetical protein